MSKSSLEKKNTLPSKNKAAKASGSLGRTASESGMSHLLGSGVVLSLSVLSVSLGVIAWSGIHPVLAARRNPGAAVSESLSDTAKETLNEDQKNAGAVLKERLNGLTSGLVKAEGTAESVFDDFKQQNTASETEPALTGEAAASAADSGNAVDAALSDAETAPDGFYSLDPSENAAGITEASPESTTSLTNDQITGAVQGSSSSGSEEKAAYNSLSDSSSLQYAPSTFNDYNVVLDTELGPMMYYCQHDSHWAQYPYGGQDPLTSYGCGPTTAAMIVNAFGNISGQITPKEMADWSASYGYYAPHSGSYHDYIPAVLSAFDLIVDSVQDRSVENASALLQSGHILVALMGPGALTNGGHFIIITKVNEDGTFSIADPNSYDNSVKSWDADQIIRELKKNYDGGGPLWSVTAE